METTKVTLDHASLVRPLEFVAEASDLRIPVGIWPKELQTDLGNGCPFLLSSVGATGCALYRQQSGAITLLVLND